MESPNYTQHSEEFFAANASNYDMAHKEGTGTYTEAFVSWMQKNVDVNVGHLKKKPGQTQWNGHATDAVLLPVGNGVYHAFDIIGNAEQPHPWVSEGGTNPDPRPTWNEDKTTNYTKADWLETPESELPAPAPSFPDYELDFGGDKYATEAIGGPLERDYHKAKQSLNAGSATWFSRTYFDAVKFTVVDGMDGKVAIDKSVAKRQPEWRKALDPSGVISW